MLWLRGKIGNARVMRGGEISRDPLVELALQFQNDLEQHLLRKLSGLTPMQAFNTIEHAVLEVGLRYFAAPSRRGGRRQPTLTSSTLALVRQKQQLAREMGRRRHETWSPLEAEALRTNYDEAAKQARTAVKKDKISTLESLARTAEEAHKDRDPRTVYQVIRRLAPPARLPTRTVRCIATGEPCRHKQHEMEEIEKAMCQIYKGTSRPLEWQAPWLLFPKIFLGNPLADTSTAMTRGSVAELYKLGVDSMAPALAGCYKVLCETGSLPQALKDGKITRLRKTKGTGENAAEDYRNISILEHRGKALVGAQLQPLMRTLQSNLDACQFGGLCAAALVTLSRWQMRFFADTGSIDEGNVLPAEHVRDSSPLNLAWP